MWSGLGHAPELKISVKKFQPERGDLLHETWKDPDGKEVKLFLPAYTAIDVEETALGVQQFFKDSYSYFNLDMCSQKDPLVAAVFKEAIRFNAEQEVASSLLLYSFWI